MEDASDRLDWRRAGEDRGSEAGGAFGERGARVLLLLRQEMNAHQQHEMGK